VQLPECPNTESEEEGIGWHHRCQVCGASTHDSGAPFTRIAAVHRDSARGTRRSTNVVRCG